MHLEIAPNLTLLLKYLLNGGDIQAVSNGEFSAEVSAFYSFNQNKTFRISV